MRRRSSGRRSVSPTTRPIARTTFAIPAGGTLLAYTDGLIERRGESLEVGLERLKQDSVERRDSVEALLATILRQTIPTGSETHGDLGGQMGRR